MRFKDEKRDETFCDLTTFQTIFRHILLRMRRNNYFWASDYNIVTTPLDSAIPISCKRQKFGQSESV